MSLRNTREKAEFVKVKTTMTTLQVHALNSWKAHLSSLKDVGFVAKEGEVSFNLTQKLLKVASG